MKCRIVRFTWSPLISAWVLLVAARDVASSVEVLFGNEGISQPPQPGAVAWSAPEFHETTHQTEREWNELRETGPRLAGRQAERNPTWKVIVTLIDNKMQNRSGTGLRQCHILTKDLCHNFNMVWLTHTLVHMKQGNGDPCRRGSCRQEWSTCPLWMLPNVRAKAPEDIVQGTAGTFDLNS